MTPKHNINTGLRRLTNDSKMGYYDLRCHGVNRTVELGINGMVLKSYILRTVDFTILGPKPRTDNIDIFTYSYISICLYLNIYILKYQNNPNPVTLTPCYIPIVQSQVQYQLVQ